MVRLINNLLNLSKIEMGNLQIKPTRVRMLQLLMDSFQAVESQALAKNIKFDLRLSAYSPSLTLLFAHAGYEVLTAHNGVRGLEQLLAARPDIAILDVMMPGRSGMDVLRAWGSQKHATDNTQFILLTASCDEEVQTFIQHCANVRFVPKPFSPKKMLSMVQATREANTIEQSTV